MRSHVVVVREPGGPEVLSYEDAPVRAPRDGEVVVRNEAIGLNFLDVYFRSGRYPMTPPFVPGHEGAGVIEALGPGVTDFARGDRVGYVDPIGAYAELAVRPAARLIRLPPAIATRQAASMLLKGMTAEYLVRRTFKVMRGQTILVHAAAGGVGQILCRWAKHIGATVLGSVGSATKRRVAEQLGCDAVIVANEQDVAAAVRDLTGGRGVEVVYDGIGGEGFTRSLDCLAPRGMMVAFGAASGPIPPLDVQTLATKGSLYLTRPMLGPYVADQQALQASADALFKVVLDGDVPIGLAQTYRLSEVRNAHRDLEARRLTGSTVLLP